MPLSKRTQHGEQARGVRDVHMPAGLWSYWRHGDLVGMAPVTGVLEWKDTGSVGGTGRGDKEGLSPSVSVNSWSVLCSAWGWMRS